MKLSPEVGLTGLVLCATFLGCCDFQIESKKAAAKNLENSVEEAKGRLATQLEEQSRLEDKIRALSIDLATEQAQVEKLHHDVSFFSFLMYLLA